SATASTGTMSPTCRTSPTWACRTRATRTRRRPPDGSDVRGLPCGAGPGTASRAVTDKLLIAVAALVGVAFAALLRGALVERSSPPPGALAASQSVEDFKAGFALNASTTSLVESLQATLEATPTDEHSWTLLGLAYQQRARETGDPSYLTKSDGALGR